MSAATTAIGGVRDEHLTALFFWWSLYWTVEAAVSVEPLRFLFWVVLTAHFAQAFERRHGWPVN